jgi:hypothetical protein
MLLRHLTMWTRGEAIGLVVCLAFIPRYSRAAEGDAAGAGSRPVAANPLASDVPTDELRRVPGALGDVGKSLESLPGVSRPAVGIGAPIVWGADAGDTRVLVDGMEIPMLYHLGGFRSAIGSAMVDSVALLPGGYGAELGRALGGVVDLETRSPPPQGYFGDLDANVFDASFAAGAGFASGGVAVGGRTSYLGRITDEAPTDGPWGQNLRYRDLQAKALFTLRPGEKIELIGLYSSDYEIPDYTFVSSAAFPVREQSFLRLGARCTRYLDDGGSVVVTPFVGSERSRTALRTQPMYGDPLSDLLSDASLSGTDVGLRASYRRPLTRWLTLKLGFDGLVTWSNLNRLGDQNSPAREGDIVLWGEEPLLGGVARDGWGVTMGNLAPSAALEFAAGKWRLIPSFRADVEVISGDKDIATAGSLERVRASRLFGAPAPRLLVSHQSTRRVQNHVAIGLYNQAPSPGDLSSVFVSPQLGLSHAMHAVAGTSVALAPGFTVEGTAFYRQLWALVTRNPNPSPPFGESLVQDGQGRVWGAELLVHFTSSILSGWLSYTFSRSERRQSSSAAYRLFDDDQNHVLSAVATASYAGFSLGARLRVASGMPRTPVTGGYFSSPSDTYEPIFGPQNSERLPTFSSLDLRIEKSFRVKRFAVTPYFEGINLTNRKNAEDYVYSPDFSQRATVTGLPMTLVAGVALKL